MTQGTQLWSHLYICLMIALLGGYHILVLLGYSMSKMSSPIWLVSGFVMTAVAVWFYVIAARRNFNRYEGARYGSR